MKRLWQDYIEAAAAVLGDARSIAETSSESNYLESLEWQVPLALTGYDIDSDGHWISEEEDRSLH